MFLFYLPILVHLCGFTPVRKNTCVDLQATRKNTCAELQATRIYTYREKTPTRKTTTADLQATRIYTYRGKTPAHFSSMTSEKYYITLHYIT